MSYARWSDGDWYIFGHVTDDKTRDGQLLAIWHGSVVEHKRLPVLPYPQVKAMRAADDWTALNCEVTDRDTLIRCVDQWLAEIEAEYP